nr:MAG TPA_asm: hypothetical protein [Caudoviricetes sp.]
MTTPGAEVMPEKEEEASDKKTPCRAGCFQT